MPVAVPCYASYPTADCMDDRFGADDYARHLRERGTRHPGPLSLHVHMPGDGAPRTDRIRARTFTARRDGGTRFLDALERELDLIAGHLGGHPVAGGLHLGGGTPTRLDGAALVRLVHAFESRFDLRTRAERTVEIDLLSVDARWVARLGGLGFHRLRVGVRSADPGTRCAIDDGQAPSVLRTIIGCARATGVHAVDVELACDLSRRDARRTLSILERIIALHPERIVLVDETHPPASLDDGAAGARLAIVTAARERLRNAGYVAIGLDHFAMAEDELAVAYRNGRLHRDLRGFTTRPDRDLLAFGPGAISDLEECMVQNACAFDLWADTIEAGRLPIGRGLVRTPDDRLRNRLINSLMCTGRIDIGSLEIDWLIDFRARFAEELARLDPLVADGLVHLDGESIEVTPVGRDRALQTISAVFDRRGRETVPEDTFSHAPCP